VSHTATCVDDGHASVGRADLRSSDDEACAAEPARTGLRSGKPHDGARSHGSRQQHAQRHVARQRLVGRLGRSDVLPAAPGRAATAAAGIARRSARVRSFVTLVELRWSVASVALFAVALIARWAGAPTMVIGPLLAGCYIAGGWEPALSGLRALRSKTLDVDVLMIIAALVAAAIGQAVDGGLLIVIFSTSGALEAVATRRTRESIRSLLDLSPERATTVGDDGKEHVVDTAVLTVGDVVVVRPGERIGADGRVVDGASDVDQASITGEPLPVVKAAGCEVFAGTVNGTGMLKVVVERAAADTVVARIVSLVEQASATKARTQLFVETVEQRYSIAVVICTLALFAIPLALGSALQPTLLRAMTFMIVASPCAVVLATMPPLLSAIANAGRHGVLVKSAVVMEQLGQATLVAFDKTGTLTEGTPWVTEVLPLDGTGFDADGLLAMAAAAEQFSEHPLAGAIVRAALARGLLLAAASEFKSVSGQGVAALVAGRRVAVSTPAPRESAGADSSASSGGAASSGEAASSGGNPVSHAAVVQVIQRLQETGCTAVTVSVEGAPVGVLGLADEIRPAAADAVTALRRLTGRSPILLTGDNTRAAEQVANQVGITDVRANLLPHDKLAAVHQLQGTGSRVVLVGDGINDAPALAAANLGVAMGRHGSDLAVESADVVVIRDELATVPAVIGLSRRAKRIVTQNLIFAGVVVVALVVVDLSGHLPLPLGVAGHEGSTVVVGLNGLRMLSRRAWTPTARRARRTVPLP